MRSRSIRSAADLRRRAERKAVCDLSDDAFRSRFATLLARVPAGTTRDHAFFYLPATMPPWLDTGLDLRAGEQVTVFAAGRSILSRELDIWVRPSFQLWYRVGERGRVFRGTRSSHTFAPDHDGRLFLAGYFPGEWTPTGELVVPSEVYWLCEGGMSMLVVRWAVSAREGLARLARCGDVDGLVASEIEGLDDPVEEPGGWQYLASVRSDAYASAASPGRPATIACYSHEDAAILHKDVAVPFAPGTRLRWSWKMDLLPSRVREDRLETHDYLSIAVEFENGQDLTYFWSAELPVDTGFRCPIPTWHARETHVVVRSGAGGLGEWVSEDRDLYADYRRWAGEPPARIVRVWLIAVSLFRRGEGQGEYGSIELVCGDRVTVVS